MTQTELNRAVAEATGETVGTIADMGFSIADLGAEPPAYCEACVRRTAKMQKVTRAQLSTPGRVFSVT